jgi:hypothetical protein
MIHEIQADLFTHGTKYPVSPGWKDRDTSKAAADAIAPTAECLRHMVLKALKVRPMSADQIAAYLGIDKLSIRPRCSELSRHRSDRPARIMDSGKRTPNASGKMAIVWVLI